MGFGGLLSFIGLVIKLLIAGSHAADGAGFQFSTSGSKKQIPIIFIWRLVAPAPPISSAAVTEGRIAARFKKQSTLGR
jgi:hypothetical protein